MTFLDLAWFLLVSQIYANVTFKVSCMGLLHLLPRILMTTFAQGNVQSSLFPKNSKKEILEWSFCTWNPFDMHSLFSRQRKRCKVQ